ncbi:UNVERIFIED_ORG: hypothetical protein M2402_003623 [Rahnella aquatilis]
MDDLHMVVLLERIGLIAKLSTYADCDPDEREIVAVWISEMAATAKEELLKAVFDTNAPGKIH